MRKLKIPSLAGKDKEIYIECASDFIHNRKYADIALSYVDGVEKCSNKYTAYVPKNIVGFLHINICDEEKEIINKVYEQKFAPKGSIGRKYYDSIIGNAKGRCPICGGGKLKNLDHFLPKSKYPLLCVTPINLIPTCRDCNMEKGATASEDYYEIPFHPYLEIMNDEWVECDLSFYPDKTFSIKFKNGFDASLNPDMWRKYEAHMRINDLAATFNSRAEEELENIGGMYKKELLVCGEKELELSLIEMKDSAEEIDVNSWKSALYRALLRRSIEFFEWLKL